jgi:hypothetical protein
MSDLNVLWFKKRFGTPRPVVKPVRPGFITRAMIEERRK